MSQSSHEWVVTQHWEQSCFKNNFYPQDLWVCLLSSWNRSYHCSWLFQSFRCRRPSAQDDVLRVSAHLNLCSWQAYSKVPGVNPREAPGGTVRGPPLPDNHPPTLTLPTWPTAWKKNRNSLVQYDLQMQQLKNLWGCVPSPTSGYVWAWGVGAVRGNVILRTGKQKTKQLPARKGKARKSTPAAI